MNENGRGFTPADVTVISIGKRGRHWHVTIEQGNGDVIKTLDLTEVERIQLAMMLGDHPGAVTVESCSFLDTSRRGDRQLADEDA